MHQSFNLQLNTKNVLIFLTILVLALLIIFSGANNHFHKALLKQERLYRDSLSKEIMLIREQNIILQEKSDSFENIINSKEKTIIYKIKKISDDKQKSVDYTIISDDSLLKRLQSKN